MVSISQITSIALIVWKGIIFSFLVSMVDFPFINWTGCVTGTYSACMEHVRIIYLLYRVRHPNIICLYGACTDHLLIVNGASPKHNLLVRSMYGSFNNCTVYMVRHPHIICLYGACIDHLLIQGEAPEHNLLVRSMYRSLCSPGHGVRGLWVLVQGKQYVRIV